jgi:hypothetical protein
MARMGRLLSRDEGQKPAARSKRRILVSIEIPAGDGRADAFMTRAPVRRNGFQRLAWLLLGEALFHAAGAALATSPAGCASWLLNLTRAADRRAFPRRGDST